MSEIKDKEIFTYLNDKRLYELEEELDKFKIEEKKRKDKIQEIWEKYKTESDNLIEKLTKLAKSYVEYDNIYEKIVYNQGCKYEKTEEIKDKRAKEIKELIIKRGKHLIFDFIENVYEMREYICIFNIEKNRSKLHYISVIYNLFSDMCSNENRKYLIEKNINS